MKVISSLMTDLGLINPKSKPKNIDITIKK